MCVDIANSAVTERDQKEMLFIVQQVFFSFSFSSPDKKEESPRMNNKAGSYMISIP